jgi:DNA-binding response OmpR family regulator
VSTKRRILIVEDEEDVAGLIKHAVERSGDAAAEIVASGDTALKVVSERPPDLRELTARVRAVLRRGEAGADLEAATYYGTRLVIDFDAVAVTVDGHPIHLKWREFELLRYLVQNKNRVVSRDRLLERVWQYDRMVETRSVDVHIGRLRAKLGVAAAHIETVVGLGYRFVD